MAEFAGTAPPGYMAICTAQGVAYVTVGDALPAETAPAADHGGRCLHFCCVAQTTALIPAPFNWDAPQRWGPVLDCGGLAAPETEPAACARARGPPAV